MCKEVWSPVNSFGMSSVACPLRLFLSTLQSRCCISLALVRRFQDRVGPLFLSGDLLCAPPRRALVSSCFAAVFLFPPVTLPDRVFSGSLGTVSFLMYFSACDAYHVLVSAGDDLFCFLVFLPRLVGRN